MTTIVVLISAICAIGVLYVLTKGARTYEGLRGTRLVTCPETKRAAAVAVDARHAALTSVFGSTKLRLEDCSRWPERCGCGQECLEQIELAPEDCLVRVVVARWYERKSCALCGKAFERIHLSVDKPGLRAADGTTLQWTMVSSESLPEILETHEPICWTCYVTEEFRRMHPELVIDVPPPEARPDALHHAK